MHLAPPYFPHNRNLVSSAGLIKSDWLKVI